MRAILRRMQLDLLSEMNRDHLAASGPNLDLEGRLDSFELAFRMQTAMPEIQSLAGEHPATEDAQERARTEQEFAEAEAYEAKWREEDKERFHQERLP